jgi:hypothetical protein
MQSAFWRSYAVVAGAGAVAYVLAAIVDVRAPADALQLTLIALLGGFMPTLALHALMLRRWDAIKSRGLGTLVCFGASWVVLICIVVASFAITGDPFRAERVAARGWISWVVEDLVLRGIFLGALVSVPLLWIWMPVGIVWYFAADRAARPRRTA